MFWRQAFSCSSLVLLFCVLVQASCAGVGCMDHTLSCLSAQARVSWMFSWLTSHVGEAQLLCYILLLDARLT